jgi:hypothetical protein
MNTRLLLKICIIWLIIAFLAVLNGLLREAVLSEQMGARLALPVSGIILCLLVLLITDLLLPWLGQQTTRTYFTIGAVWVCITLIFEFVFGHYVAGKSWHELRQVFNLLNGNLFILVLLTSFIAPYTAARFRGWLITHHE